MCANFFIYCWFNGLVLLNSSLIEVKWQVVYTVNRFDDLIVRPFSKEKFLVLKLLENHLSQISEYVQFFITSKKLFFRLHMLLLMMMMIYFRMKDLILSNKSVHINFKVCYGQEINVTVMSSKSKNSQMTFSECIWDSFCFIEFRIFLLSSNKKVPKIYFIL